MTERMKVTKHQLKSSKEWEQKLKDLFCGSKIVKKRARPLPPETSVASPSLRTEVENLHALCDYRLDVEDVTDALKGLETDNLQVQCLGQDDEGSIYWYFYGTRLYKQSKSLVKKTHLSNNTNSASWSLVCSTREEWQALADKFNKSNSKDEEHLYTKITLDFLPFLENLGTGKEKSCGNHLMEMAPRRTSLRIERKNQVVKKGLTATIGEKQVNKTQEKQRKIPKEIKNGEGEPLDKISRTEERKCSVKEEKRRVRQKSLITKQASFHEGRKYLDEKTCKCSEVHHVSARKNCVFLKSPSGVLNASGRKYDIYSKYFIVLWEVKNKPESWPFLYPVDEVDAPGYYSVIQDPIDLMTIEKKIECKEYTNTEEFLKDFKKMVDNCQQYNGNRSVYMAMARKVWKYFLQAMKKNFPDELNYNANQVVNIMKHKSNSDITLGLDIKKDMSTKILRQNVRGGKSKKKRKKRQPGIKAIEVLAKAAEKALQDTALQNELQQMNLTSNNTSLTTVSSAFPDLKISTTQSHPDDLLLRYCPDNFFCTSAKLKDFSELHDIHTSKPCIAENEYLCQPSITEQTTQDISNIEQQSPQNSSTIKYTTAQHIDTIKHQITSQHSSTGEQHNVQTTSTEKKQTAQNLRTDEDNNAQRTSTDKQTAQHLSIEEEQSAQRTSTDKQTAQHLSIEEEHGAQRTSTDKQTAQHLSIEEEHGAQRTSTNKQQTAHRSSIDEQHSAQRTNIRGKHSDTNTVFQHTTQNTSTVKQNFKQNKSTVEKQNIDNMSFVEKSNAQSPSITKQVTGQDINFSISHSSVSQSAQQSFIEIKGIEEVTAGKETVEKLDNLKYIANKNKADLSLGSFSGSQVQPRISRNIWNNICTPINLTCSSLLNCDNFYKDTLSDVNQTRRQSQSLQNQILTQQNCSTSHLNLAISSNLMEPFYSVNNNFKTLPENVTSECCTENVGLPSCETHPISPSNSFGSYQLLRNICNGTSCQPSSSVLSEPSGDGFYILSDTVEMDTKFPLTSQSMVMPVLNSSLNSVPITLNDYNVLQPYKPHTSITSSRLSLGTCSSLNRDTLIEKYLNVSDTTPTLTSTVTGVKSINPASTNESHVLWDKMPSNFPFNSFTCKIPHTDAPESSDFSDIIPIPEKCVMSFSPFPNEVNSMAKSLFAQQSTVLSKSESCPFHCLPVSISSNHSNLSKPSAIVNPIILPIQQQSQPLLPLNSLHQQVMTRSEPVGSVHTPHQQFMTQPQPVPPLNIPYLQVLTQPKPLMPLNTSHQQTKTWPQSVTSVNTVRQHVTTCSQITSSVDTLVYQKEKPQTQPLCSVNSLQQHPMVQPHLLPALKLHQQPIMFVPEKPYQPLPEVFAFTETLELGNNKEDKSTATFPHSSQKNPQGLSRRDDSRRFHCDQTSTQEVLSIESFLDSEKYLSPQLSSTTDFSKFGISLTIDKNKTQAASKNSKLLS